MTKTFVNNGLGLVNQLIMRKRRKQDLPRPTDTELSILSVLWNYGPGTVREVLKHFNQDNETDSGYTTILKMLQIMYDKGLVDRDATQRPQVYSAVLQQEETQRQLLTHLLDKAFGGSAKRLVMQALASKDASDEELAHIERLLDRVEGGSK